MIRFSSFIWLWACSGSEKSGTVIQVEEVARDNDGDGFNSDEDCDDSNSTINPGATEICDGIDNDCSGVVDDGAREAYFADSDSDGYGNPDIITEACSPPIGFVTTGTDCDDTDENTHPGADEVCDDRDNNCNDDVDEDLATDFYQDSDDDGFGDDAVLVEACALTTGLSAIGGDCDDDNAAISPLSMELCDGVDNDCDGDTDEEVAQAFFADVDSDGYGDPESVLEACEIPVGYTENTLDCNDTDSEINPSADEYCDGQDNDCDGDTDEDFSVDAHLYFADGDGDGFGDITAYTTSCSPPSGYVENALDCNDNNSLIGPDGAEFCNGIDDDCDGSIDEEDSTNAFVWFADYDDDGYGDSDSAVSACNQPSDHIAVADDCDDNDNDIHPGATELCDGEDNDCDGIIDTDAPDYLTYYTDNDGDGYGDDDTLEQSCGLPSGAVEEGGDCDDENEEISPEASEICDLADNDCDEVIDGADAIDISTWYLDGDIDGYGDESTSQESCAQPVDHVPDNQDCNDSDATINPNATEVYYDGIDQDCDSESDFDQDKDGFDSIDFGGLDINDLDETCAESCRDGSTSEYAGVTCGTILEDFSASVNGSYYIDPNNDGDTADAISVFCDMSGGGWTYESSGQPFTLSFTGGVQELDTVGTEAEYLFTLYGAQGGDGQNNTGGLGGMAAASKTFSASTTLFVYIGGKGSDGGAADSGGCSTRTGGFNGGGRGSQGGSGGGGATDIRALDTLSDRILVAAGGGGCGGQNCYGSGGDGGGLTGSTGQHVGSGLTDFLGGEGGTQNSGGTSPNSGSADGTFGSGGDNVQCNDEAGGGGGWYGGAAGGNSNTTGGGGSSYYDGMDADQDTSTGAQSGNGHVEYIFR